MSKITLIFFLAVISCFPSLAQDSSRADSKARLEKEIRILEDQISAASNKSSNAMASLELVLKKEKIYRTRIAESDREIASVKDSIRLCDRQIKAINARLDTITLYYRRLVRNAYKNRDARVWYMYILASTSLGQAGHRYSYLRNLSRQMNIQGRKIAEARKELEIQKARLVRLKSAAEKVRAERQKDYDSLKSEEARSRKIITQLNRQKSKYQAQLRTKKQQKAALDREVQKVIRTKDNKPVDIKLSGEFESNMGKLPWPAEGPVIESFGQHNHPVYTKVVMPFNNGITIGLDKDAAIKAVFDGEARKVIVMPGYGKCLLVQHGNYFSFYCKLKSVSVKAGDKIKTGQTVGIVDTVDGQTRFHFQIWKGTVPQNPEEWLRTL